MADAEKKQQQIHDDVAAVSALSNRIGVLRLPRKVQIPRRTWRTYTLSIAQMSNHWNTSRF